jgi:predicted nucleic acid-binding protein
MITAIVDSTIVIQLFRGQPNAEAWYNGLTNRLSVTPITWLEVLRGANNKATLAKCKTILNGFDMEYLTPADMDQAIRWMEQYRFSHGLGMNDSLIASVAFRLQVPLYTHNVKDMQPLIGALAAVPY